MKRMFWQICFLALLVSWLFGSRVAGAFEFKGFGDVTYADNTSNRPVDPTNNQDRNSISGRFALGTLDLYLSEPITDRLEVLAEIAIEPDRLSGEMGIDLERFQIGYVVNDALKIRAGRFHIILGYWNTAFHHGSQIQTSIDRPVFLRFEDGGGILPVHAVGLWVEGRYRLPVMLVHYGAMFTNGSKIMGAEPPGPGTLGGTLDMNNNMDNSPNKQITFQVRVSPSFLPNLAVGVSGNFSKVQGIDPVNPADVMEVSQQIYSADIEFINRYVEFLSEYYAIRDKDELGSTGTNTSAAYYAQLAVTISDQFVPYARFERMSIRENDPYFNMNTGLGTTDEKKYLVGLRYNLTENSSLKGEVNWIEPSDGNGYRLYQAQWAFEF
jgi:hypothetical protein